MAAIEFNNSPLKTTYAANLQGYWKLEDANDSSANAYNLTNTGTATFAAAVFNNGVSLNGSSQYLSIADASCPNLEISGSQTWGCWMKPTDLPASDVYTVMGKANNTSSTTQHRLYINTTGTIGFDLEGTSTGFITSTPVVTAGVWNHVVGVYDSVAGKLFIYINGQGQSVANTGTVGDSNAKFSIGCEFSAASDTANRFYKGMVDDAFVLNTALSADQVKELYEGRSVGELWPNYSANLKAIYHLSGTTDSSGNSYHLTNTNTVTFPSAKFNNGADLGPTNTNKELQVANDFGIEGGSISIGLWVKLNTEIGSGTYGIAGQSGATSFVYNYIWYEYNAGTRRLVFTRLKNGTATNSFYYNVALGTSVYHHIVYTFDGSTVKGYFDGNLVTSGASSGNGASGGSDGFEIGRDYSGNFGSFVADECLVFNSAWSAAEIKNYYAWAKGRRTGTV